MADNGRILSGAQEMLQGSYYLLVMKLPYNQKYRREFRLPLTQHELVSIATETGTPVQISDKYIFRKNFLLQVRP